MTVGSGQWAVGRGQRGQCAADVGAAFRRPMPLRWSVAPLADLVKKFRVLSLLVGTVLLTCGPARTSAQQSQTFAETKGAVDRLLQSPDAKDVAWGAFTAGQYQVRSALPLLTAALGRDLGGDPNTSRAAELAILDALVQLEARLPVEAIGPSLARWPIPTLILLNSALGDREALLLEHFSRTGGFEWRAVANLLLKTKPAGFAFRLLDGLRLNLAIHVTDDPNVLGGGVGGSCDGPNYAVLVPGFPPLAHYQFVLAEPGATILSIGPETVYYVRRLRSPATILPLDRSNVARADDHDRVKYVNALVRERVEMVPLRHKHTATIRWTDSRALQREISVHRRRVEEHYEHVLSVLKSIQRLSEDESRKLTPNVTITVEDYRTDKTETLPPIPQP
jgi:hypothetical protein